jgi:hypothetical protein
MLVVLMIVGLCVHTAAALPGSGTQEDPWRIESLADFDEFAADPNYWSGFTRLETDVNLAGRTYTTAVIAPDVNNSNYDFDGTAFTGVFDGNGHKMMNLTIDDGGTGIDYLGLFGCIEEGEVRNLRLEGGSVTGGWAVGGLVGQNGGIVSNCYSTGSVSGDNSVGGLVGGNYGSVSNCYSTGSVSGDNSVGGLVGHNYFGSFSNCYSTGSVSGGYHVGGLVGGNWHGSVSNCYSTGSVSGTEWSVGGLVGYNDGSVSDCYSTGDVSSQHDVGGLVGGNNGSISNCYSTGSVSGEGGVGGLVGENRRDISNCYSTGDVSGYGDVGGLAGFTIEGNISNCYSTGSVSGQEDVGGLVGRNYVSNISICYSSGDVHGDRNVGGLVGENEEGSVSNCFWDTDTQRHGVTNSFGYNDGIVINVVGLPTDEMKTKSTFTSAGWDFIEIWGIGEGQTYPYLRFAPAGDFNYDKKVDLFDFAIFADHWLEGKVD